jgi:hypothetical protein
LTSNEPNEEGEYMAIPLSQIFGKLLSLSRQLGPPKLEERAPDEWKNTAREIDQLVSLLDDARAMLEGVVRIVDIDGVQPHMVTPILITGVTSLAERLIRVKGTLEATEHLRLQEPTE